MTIDRTTDADLELVDPAALEAHPDNPRVHDDELIRQSIEDHGVIDTIVAQRSRRRILGGHGRWESAVALGATKVPVLWVDCDDAEAEEILLVLNRSADQATYNLTALQEILERVRGDDSVERLKRSGWTEEALSRVRKDLAASTHTAEPVDPAADFDAAGELAREYGTASGQLWAIRGAHEHRLLIADASDPASAEQLLAGESIDLLVSSPPYNVGVGYAGSSDTEGDGHDDSTVPWPAYREFLLGVLSVWLPHLAPGRFVAWNVGWSPKVAPHRHVVMLEDDCGLTYRRLILWDKAGVPLPTWQMSVKAAQVRRFSPHPTVELVVLATKGETSPGALWDGHDELFGRDLVRIAASSATRDLPAGDAQSGTQGGLNRARKAHPAVFPVALPAGLATHLADPGAIVFDPFMGAGTTILAAEQRGRRGYGTELSPEYAAVALFRAVALGMTVEQL